MLTWITQSNSLGIIRDSGFLNFQLEAQLPNQPINQNIRFEKISGEFPEGITLSKRSGIIQGNLQITSIRQEFSFIIRASSNTEIADRIFYLTAINDNTPSWITESDDLPYGMDGVEYYYELGSFEPNSEIIKYSFESGGLPPGSSMNDDGIISGRIQKLTNSEDYTFFVGIYRQNFPILDFTVDTEIDIFDERISADRDEINDLWTADRITNIIVRKFTIRAFAAVNFTVDTQMDSFGNSITVDRDETGIWTADRYYILRPWMETFELPQIRHDNNYIERFYGKTLESSGTMEFDLVGNIPNMNFLGEYSTDINNPYAIITGQIPRTNNSLIIYNFRIKPIHIYNTPEGEFINSKSIEISGEWNDYKLEIAGQQQNTIIWRE